MNFLTVILIVASLLTTILAIYAWNKRKVFETYTLVGLLFSISVWSIASAFKLVVDSLAAKELINFLGYLGIVSVPVWFFLFALSYTGISKVGGKVYRFLLWLVPLVTLVSLSTNRLHWLYYTQSTIENIMGWSYHNVVHGPLWWINFTYSYFLITLAIILFIRMYVNGSNVQRKSLMIIIVASFFPILSNVLYVVGLKPLSFIDLTPLAFSFTGIIFFWGIYSSNMLAVKPIALNKLFNSLSEGIVVTDKDKRIIDMNPSAQRILMINTGCIGKPIGEAISSDIDFETIQQVNQYERVLIEGKIAEANFSGIVIDNGEIAGFVLLVRDISERVKVESALRSASERIELAVLAAGIDTWENDLIANLRIGGSRIFTELGYSDNEVPSTIDQVYNLVHPDDIEYLKKRMQEHFDGKISVYSCDFRYRDKMGNYQWMSSYGRLIERDIEGKPYLFIGITLNINNRKQGEEKIQRKNKELIRANSEKDKFFSIIAHDLKGPFQGFIGLTEFMSENLADMTTEQVQEITGSLQTTAKNLYELLDNLLNWALIKRGHKRFNPEKVYLRSLVHIVSELFSSQLKVKDITLINRIDEDFVALADKESLKTVLRNLISNAVKFTPHKGIVTISSDLADKSFLLVAIVDTGIGMSNEIRESLFAITKKVSRPGTDNEPSTGLGLILCKELIEKHGGRIWVESTEGKGSAFYFTVPSAN